MEKLSVLLVDDEDAFRQAIAKRLAKRGIITEQASNGKVCFSILEKKAVDVVVLDVKMPGMNGIQILQQIKEKFPDIEVILLTGHGSIQDGVEAVKLGAFDYLTKPPELEHLIGKIEQAQARIQRDKEKGREAEARYHALLQSVTDYVIAINRNHQIITANSLFMNEFGGRGTGYCYNVWKNRDEKCEGCVVEKSFQDGDAHISEETVIMKDGSPAQMRIQSTPVRDRRGKIVYVLETATNLTEKKRLQRELNRVGGSLETAVQERLRHLEKSEERYRTIVERSLDAMVLTDPKGAILEINQAAIGMLGCQNREEVLNLGTALTLFQNQEELSSFQKKLLRDGLVTEFEAHLSKRDGKIFQALISSNVILDVVKHVTGYVMIIRDITKRRKAQQEIEKQNTRLAALNALSVTINRSLDLKDVLTSTIDKTLEIVDPDSVRIYLLDVREGVLRLTAHKGLSKEIVEMRRVKVRKVGDGLVGQAFQTGKTQVIDNLLRSKDAYVEFLIEAGFRSTVYIPLTSKGEAVGVMCVSSKSAFTFSTDYVEFLTAIGNQIGVAIHNARLYEDIKTAYQELKEAQEQVIRTEKLASLGKLSASIAHEINNPIAAVLTYIKLMIKLVSQGHFTQERMKDISRYLGTMASEMTRCGEIVKNLLAFSRQSKIEIKPHDIDQILNKTLILTSHDLQLKEIQLRSDIAPDLPKVMGDFWQLQQVFMNLISNGSEAMEKGGTLSISARPAKKDGFLEIVISDTGCGISGQDQKSIFEPFFTTKEEEKGVGLGLSVVYGIITNHKGSIEVESEVGKGSTFRVFLPVNQSAAIPEEMATEGKDHG